MKINGDISPTNPTYQKNNLSSDFKKWMTPAGENSGQDFYWQHQNDLQQSALQFEAENPTEKSIFLENSNPEKQRYENAIETENNPSAHTKNQSIFSLQIRQNQPLIMPEKTNPLSIRIHNPLLLSPIDNPEKTYFEIQATAIKKTCSKMLALPLSTFHRHRIFMNGKECEISLNLTDKKISYEPLKTWFIQQGLRLGKLRINGIIQ